MTLLLAGLCLVLLLGMQQRSVAGGYHGWSFLTNCASAPARRVISAIQTNSFRKRFAKVFRAEAVDCANNAFFSAGRNPDSVSLGFYIMRTGALARPEIIAR